MTAQPELAAAEQLPPDITVDPAVALREIALAFHDFTCEEMKANGVCTEVDRAKIQDSYDAVMPGLIAVANVATQMALLHLTVKFDLSPEEAVAYGIYSSVDWGSLLPLLNCPVRKTLDNGDVVECQERGMHPQHKGTYNGITTVWMDEDPDTEPETPEEAIRRIMVTETHDEAVMEDDQRRIAAYHAEQARLTEELLAEEARREAAERQDEQE